MGRRGEEAVELARRRRTDPRALLRQIRGDLDWIPFPKEVPAGGEVSFRESLGFTFAGYPLDFAAGCRVGLTAAAAPLHV